MYIFGRFDEVSAIRKPKIITSSITGSQIFFADFVFFTKTKRNTAYRKTVNNTTIWHLIIKDKVAEQHILGKYSNCNSFGVTMDLLNCRISK